jgi:hypothetical protein
MLCLLAVVSCLPIGCGGGIEEGAPSKIEFDHKNDPPASPSPDMGGKSATPKI